jgi:hypothetical protein
MHKNKNNMQHNDNQLFDFTVNEPGFDQMVGLDKV